MRRRAPPLALRPLLFVLLSLFLVLPMLVYNFVTLDAAQIARWTDARAAWLRLRAKSVVDDAQAVAALPLRMQQCVAANSTQLRAENGVAQLGARCFARQLASEVQDIVHFVYLPVQMVPLRQGETKPPSENFTMAQFAAFQSIRRHANPSLMVLHYPATEPRSFWYTQCQRYLALHRVTFPKLPTTTKHSSLNVYQRRDVIQLVLALRALRKQGGIAFTDFNSILLHATAPLRQLPFFAGRTRRNSLSISPTMISANMGNGVVAYLESKLLTMLETDDIRLQDTPLDVLLGELIIEKDAAATPAAAAKMPNVVVATPAVLDSVPASVFSSIVQSKTPESSLSLREALVFRMPTSQPSHSEAYTSIVNYDKHVHDLETLADDSSTLSAILRLATSRNETNELDAVLL